MIATTLIVQLGFKILLIGMLISIISKKEQYGFILLGLITICVGAYVELGSIIMAIMFALLTLGYYVRRASR